MEQKRKEKKAATPMKGDKRDMTNAVSNPGSDFWLGKDIIGFVDEIWIWTRLNRKLALEWIRS